MRTVFEIANEKKALLLPILEGDPYGELSPAPFAKMSFSRNGYKLKDGVSLGEDGAKLYLVLRGPDEFLGFAKLKLDDMATECPAEKAERIVKKVEEEESGAEQGMGAIFG